MPKEAFTSHTFYFLLDVRTALCTLKMKTHFGDNDEGYPAA